MSVNSLDSDRLKEYRNLLESAKQAMTRTYSPYSEYPVGSAVLTEDGKVFGGCNVENASYGGTICAERTAIVKAVSEGYRRFKAIAVVSGKSFDCWPCGLCRQFICEFGADIELVVETKDGEINSMPIGQLLPNFFGPAALGK